MDRLTTVIEQARKLLELERLPLSAIHANGTTINLYEWALAIAVLRRGPERPPSGEMVMVPREPTQAMMDAAAALCTRGDEVYRLRSLYRAMLSVAEAEGRKS